MMLLSICSIIVIITSTIAAPAAPKTIATSLAGPHLRLDIKLKGLNNLTSRHESGLKEIKATLDELEIGQNDLQTDLNSFSDVLQSNQSTLKSGQRNLKTGLIELKSGQSTLKSGENDLKLELSLLQSGQAMLKYEQRNQKTALDNLAIGQGRMISGQTEIKIGQSVLKSGLKELKTGLNNLTASQNQLKNDITAELKSELASLKADLKSLLMKKSTSSTRPTRNVTSTGTSCGFETDFCDWKHDSKPKHHWRRNSGPTASKVTGPTGANSGKYYIHLESSSPMKAGETSRIISKTFINDKPMCLNFAYHMYGATISYLRVYVKSGSQMKRIWSKQGTQGKSWKSDTIDMSSFTMGFSTFSVVFEATCGMSFTGDISLDDINIAPCNYGNSGGGKCESGWVPYLGRCYRFMYNGGPADTARANCHNFGSELATVRSQQHNDFLAGWIPTKYDHMWTGLRGSNNRWTWPDGTNLGDMYYSNMGQDSSTSCTFETNYCDWKHDSKKHHWTRRSGATPSTSTGPKTAYSGRYYIHMETSSPMNKGEKARLVSKTYQNDKAMCLKFAYHMYGATISWLRVYVKSGSQSNLIWSKYGNQGMAWMTTTLDMSSYTSAFSTFSVVFEGTCGDGYTGDISLDDINVSPCVATRPSQQSGCVAINKKDKRWSTYSCSKIYQNTMHACEKDIS